MFLPTDITVNNLKDFYQMILPYLNVGNGGTSDTPLGQVAFFDDVVAPAGWLIADGTVYNIADYPDLANQFERVHGSKNYYGGNGTTTFAVPDWDAIPTEVFGNANIICMKAVPSSDMNTYSTTERRVGTWIDGKPIYQKTYTGNIDSSIIGWHSVDDDTTKIYISGSGVAIRSNGDELDIHYSNCISLGKVNNKLSYGIISQEGRDIFSGGTYNFTLQYTKTTD